MLYTDIFCTVRVIGMNSLLYILTYSPNHCNSVNILITLRCDYRNKVIFRLRTKSIGNKVEFISKKTYRKMISQAKNNNIFPTETFKTDMACDNYIQCFKKAAPSKI